LNFISEVFGFKKYIPGIKQIKYTVADLEASIFRTNFTPTKEIKNLQYKIPAISLLKQIKFLLKF